MDATGERFLDLLWHQTARIALMLPVIESCCLSSLCKRANATLREERRDLGRSWFDIAENLRYGMCGERINVPKASYVYCRAARLLYPGAVGKCWMLGLDGREANPDEALQAYLVAAREPFRDRNAMFQLGRLYYLGEGGTAQDLALSFKYTRAASEKGHPVAQFNLGRLCYNGTPSQPKDYARAVFWYTKSADQGYAYAQHNLAICLQEGRGCEVDLPAAARYLHLAAAQGPDQRNAMFALAYVYQDGEGVDQSDERAFYWFMQSAEAGYARAQCVVGDCYHAGLGVESDNVEMARWYRRASEQNFQAILLPPRSVLLEQHLPALEALESESHEDLDLELD